MCEIYSDYISSAYILMVPMIGKIRDNAGRRAVLKTLKVHTGRLTHLVMPLAIQISYEILTSLHRLLLPAWWCCHSWCHPRTRVVWWSRTHSHRFTMNLYINAHNHWDSKVSEDFHRSCSSYSFSWLIVMPIFFNSLFDSPNSGKKRIRQASVSE